MTLALDLVGQRFGRLVALEIVGRSIDRKILWRCQCDCGQEVIVRSGKLKSGHSKSCGCLVADQLRDRKLIHGHKRRAKAGGATPTYYTWVNMKRRCEHKENWNYKYYGGRGIRVCGRWQAFENFLADMGERPADRTLDRVNPDGNYEPSNCRWATRIEQARNRSVARSTWSPANSYPA